MSKEISTLSEDFPDKIRYVIQDNDWLRASRSLRAVFFGYLRFQDGLSDKDFDMVLTDIEATISLLECISDESKRG